MYIIESLIDKFKINKIIFIIDKKKLNKIKTNVTDPSPAPAIKAIQKAGGVAIWAHPLGGEGEKRLSPERFQKELSDLLEMGIQGL